MPGSVSDAGPGDAADAGDADAATCSTTLSFVDPVDGAQLTEKNDVSGDLCKDGFQYDVVVASGAPNGTSATLYANASKLAQTSVQNAVARFPSVTLNSKGTTTLRVDVGTCEATANVTVSCAGVASCEISKPVITATHPMLNGVPVAQGGDRVSADGSPYQAAFEVTTDISDGQPVLLHVNGGPGISVNATGGKANFGGVTLAPDGDFKVQATCISKSGLNGTSPQATYTVDTQAPALAPQKQTQAGASVLQDGDHFGPADDADPSKAGLQLRICGTTTSADAIDLPASLGSAQQNYCAAVGTSSPACLAATTGGSLSGNGACVDLDCPGGGPFDLNLTLRDEAGNPTTKTIKAVTCASSLPMVQIVDPLGDAPPYADTSKHLLAASMPSPQLRDQDATKSGAQYTVTACTSATSGTATLSGGLVGGTLSPIATANVAPDTAGLCTSANMTHVVQFTSATLPESAEDNSGALTTATALQVEVTDSSGGSGSAEADLWVDSGAPVIAAYNPNPLCGMTYQSTTPVTATVYLSSTALPVSLSVTPQNGTPATYVSSTLALPDVVQLPGVVFDVGANEAQATTTEPSGNVGYLHASGASCAVTVGNPPIVTWKTPLGTSRLAASTTSGTDVIADADPATADWQGTLQVCTNVNVTANPGVTVQFSTSVGGSLGSPIALDASGCATYPNATIPQGVPVVITATTSDVGGYTGKASISVPVDVEPPAAITDITASVKDRRQTTMHLAWTAPSDNLKLDHYRVRVAKSPIATQAQFDAAQSVIWTGTPAAAGSQDGVDATSLFIENDYYFAVQPVDKAGNVAAFTATSTAARAKFNETLLSSPDTGTQYGRSFDGSSSLNGDAYSDLVVGTYAGRRVFIYFGGPGGYAAVPDVTIEGAVAGCGRDLAVVGDIDSDGLPDIAISCPDQTVHIVKGRATWPSLIQLATQTDYLIQSDSTADPKYSNSGFGSSITRLGDLNGDGVADFAFGAPFYGSNLGQVILVYGAAAGAFPAQVVAPTDVGGRLGVINGTVDGGMFGYALAGLGQYYSQAASSLLVQALGVGSYAGTVYAFGGPLGSSAAVATDAKNSVSGAAPNTLLGWPIRILGNVGGTPDTDVALGAAWAAGGGSVSFYFGSPSVGPFGGTSTSVNDTSSAPSYFGTGIIGGGFNGSAVTTSFIGDAAPDVALAATKENGGPPRIYILSGSAINSSGDAGSLASVVYDRVPADWVGTSGYGNGTIRDLNGDGYGDLCLGEDAPTTHDGRVLVLW